MWSFSQVWRGWRRGTWGKRGQGGTVTSASITCNQDGSSASQNQPRRPAGSFCASWASVWCQVSLQYLPKRVSPLFLGESDSPSPSIMFELMEPRETRREKGKRRKCEEWIVPKVPATDSAVMKLPPHWVTSADSTPPSWLSLITFIPPSSLLSSPLLTFPYASPSAHCLTCSLLASLMCRMVAFFCGLYFNS